MNYISGNEKNNPGTASNILSSKQYSHNFYLLKGCYDRYFKINKHVAFGLLAEGVYSNKKTFSNYVSTVLSAPSFNPIPYSKTIFLNNFHADKYVATGIKGIIKFSDQLHFRAEAYGFAPLSEIVETNNYMAVFKVEKFPTIKFMGSGALVYKSALGPISFSVNYYDKSQTKFFAMFNIGYILFNRRGY
jgi:NTE family protein